MEKLTFKEDTHQYFCGEQELTSVTKFIHGHFPTFDEKRMSKLVAKRRREKGELNKNGKPINARDVKKEWEFKRVKASTAGSLTHFEIEDYILNKDEVVVPVFTPKAQQAIKWLYKGEYADKEIETELKIFNTELGLAGTIDVSIKEDGKVTLIDWKTSRQITKKGYGKGTSTATKSIPNANYYHYNLQLSTYAYMLERQGYEVQDLLLVHLLDDGVVVYEMDYNKDVVKEMIKDGKKDE